MLENEEKEIYEQRLLAEKRILETQTRVFGERFAGANLGKIRLPLEAQKKLARFLEKPKHFLLYCGNPGLGKSYFCAALTGWAISTFDTWRHWKESTILTRVRSSMDDYKGDYLQTLKNLIDDQLLMLDDVGSDGHNAFREEILFEIIDTRYNTMLPTIITSNFSLAEFRKLYHPRICSRLFATENIIIEILDGPDMRALGK